MNRIKELREKSGKSQEVLANLLGVQVATISRYEKGLREPDNNSLIKLAEFFEVTTDYLLGRSDTPNPPASKEDTDFLIATFGDARDYSETEIKEIKDFIEYIKSKRK